MPSVNGSSILSELRAQTLQDPQLPRENPTVSFWQVPVHPTLSEIQSESLPSTTDFAIIGSGVTGCSIAKNLLELSPGASNASSVTVFEARTLTSGATGRNGGLLTSFVPGDYKMLSEAFGADQATKIARFANRTLDKMHGLANSTPELKEASVVRKLQDVICIQDEESFAEVKESIEMYEDNVPEDRGKAQFLTPEETKEKYNMNAVAGSLVYPNGAFWPYRLITGLWAQLYEQHRSRLSIETKTPVTEITYDAGSNNKYPYILSTPRGAVRAAKVIHATNGYTGHLLPELRGKIYPLRGTMSTQKSTPEFGQHGRDLSWSIQGGGSYDATTQIAVAGLYYANQNPNTGDIFIGGEKANIAELFVSDDTVVGAPAAENLETILPRIFAKGWGENQKPEVHKIWSGIMGFTADHLPLVGQLPQSYTRRGVDGGEWVAAGFNGYGMPLCWSCGEAIAKMLLGKDVSDFLPEAFLATSDRLDDSQRMDSSGMLNRLTHVQ